MLSKHLAAKRAQSLALTFLGALALICLRLWYLAIVCHEDFEERAGRPQVRSEEIAAERGAICDRFGLPLASNKLHFEIAVRYSEIQNATVRQLAESAAKALTRPKYVDALAEEISKHCQLTTLQVKDQILAKSALTPSLNVAIAQDISYAQFAALKLIAPQWPGLSPRVTSQRIYPLGVAASHVLGHMGFVGGGQLKAIESEIRSIASMLEIEESWPDRQMLQKRLDELQSQYRRRSDRVGKAGLEQRMEGYLKGIHGKMYFEVDARGRPLRRLSERAKPPEHGNCLQLCLSAELQQQAEILLSNSEKAREVALQRGQWPSPWIKGGVIAAIDPNNGEVLALASSPNFDPNDFASSSFSNKERIMRWIESKEYLGSIWDGLQPLERSFVDQDNQLSSESRDLTWSHFLQLACGQRDHLVELLSHVPSIGEAFVLCRAFGLVHNASAQMLGRTSQSPIVTTAVMLNHLYPPPCRTAIGSTDKKDVQLRSAFEKRDDWRAAVAICDRYLSSIERNDHKLLVIDLLGLLFDEKRAPPELARCQFSLDHYKEHAQAYNRLENKSRKIAEQWYTAGPFAQWQRENQRYFIAARRLQEEQKSRVTRPYIDYLEEERKEQFADYWSQKAIETIAALAMNRPVPGEQTEGQMVQLLARELAVAEKSNGDLSLLQKACCALFEKGGAATVKAYLKSFRPFSQLNRPLLGTYPSLRAAKGLQKERDLALSFCPKGGFGFMRSLAWSGASAQGSIFKLVIAYEALRQRWKPFCKNEQLNPLTMWDFVRQQGGRTFVGADCDGRLIRQMHSGGRLPRSSRKEIGKIDLIGAITSSSNPYFSLLASQEMSLEDLKTAIGQFGFGQLTGIELAGEVAGNVPKDLEINQTGLYNLAIGQHALAVTPLQTARMLSALGNGGELIIPHLIKLQRSQTPHRGLFLPKEIRQMILEGMHRVSYSPEGCASTSAIRTFALNAPAMSAYRSLKGQFVGKTSTAETDEWTSIASRRPERCSNIWFGGISFASQNKSWTRPELVVVVYLPHGTFGKEAAPIAAQMATKWRQIRSKGLRQGMRLS